MRSRKNVWVLMAAGALLTSMTLAQPVGKRAPEFTLKTLEGRTVKSSDYKGKKVLLLNFWASF